MARANRREITERMLDRGSRPFRARRSHRDIRRSRWLLSLGGFFPPNKLDRHGPLLQRSSVACRFSQRSRLRDLAAFPGQFDLGRLDSRLTLSAETGEDHKATHDEWFQSNLLSAGI